MGRAMRAISSTASMSVSGSKSEAGRAVVVVATSTP
jgi:hypothetical protein